MRKILVVDDDDRLRALLAEYLGERGFAVEAVADGEAGLERVKADHFDLVVLDVMLPGMSGLEVCRVLKSEPSTRSIPILMLTAKAEEVDRIVGLELGADDYVTKPFSPRELVLRVRSILRRNSATVEATDILRHGDIQVDRARYEVQVRGKAIEFTATEFKLLTVLMERRGRVQSRDTLLNDVWGYESLIDTRTVDTHIRRLREKLGKAADCIETIRGFGYRMVDA